MSEGTNNTVYKFMTDNLQLALITVLFRSILNAKVLRGSVATPLRCDRIFNDRCIVQSLLSLIVKEF